MNNEALVHEGELVNQIVCVISGTINTPMATLAEASDEIINLVLAHHKPQIRREAFLEAVEVTNNLSSIGRSRGGSIAKDTVIEAIQALGKE